MPRRRPSSPRPVRVVAAALVAALLGAAVLIGSASAGAAARPHVVGGAGCTDPVVRDPYDGFQVGVPARWNLLTLGNLLVVAKDTPDVEAAVVYPALLAPGQSATQFFNVALRELQQDAAANHDALNFKISRAANGLPQAILSGRGAGAPIAGQATLSIVADKTAHGSKLAVVSAYWAPPASLGADRAALASVGACYQPRPAELFQVVSDQAFTYSIPPGWLPVSEGQDTLTIALGTTAAASYLLTFLPPNTGVTSAATMLAYVFRAIGVTITKSLVTVRFPSEVDASGALDSFEYVEFTGTYQSAPVHGLASVLSVAGSAGASGVLRYAVASAPAWNTDNGALRRIVGGIQHNFTQDLQQWEHLQQQWQSFGQQEQAFDNVINGVDLVQDPSTGKVYEAPYESYSPNGPDGPGYYQDGRQLTVVNPSSG